MCPAFALRIIHAKNQVPRLKTVACGLWTDSQTRMIEWQAEIVKTENHFKSKKDFAFQLVV